MLIGRACGEYLDGLGALGVAAGGIPDFRRLSDVLDRTTGWRIVAVPGLVPDACSSPISRARRFPSTCFIRRRDQLDYLQEPDVFHDICGHVPLLMNPVFADYMQAYGEGGLKAQGLGHLQQLGAALLVHGRVRADRDPGRACASTARESSRRPANRSIALTTRGRIGCGFDLRRVMRTRYRIDRFQETYFVIDDFAQLFAATRPDFTPIYREIAVLPDLDPDAVLECDRRFRHRGEHKKMGRSSKRGPSLGRKRLEDVR